MQRSDLLCRRSTCDQVKGKVIVRKEIFSKWSESQRLMEGACNFSRTSRKSFGVKLFAPELGERDGQSPTHALCDVTAGLKNSLCIFTIIQKVN